MMRKGAPTLAVPASTPPPAFCTVKLRLLVTPTGTAPKLIVPGETETTGLVLPPA